MMEVVYDTSDWMKSFFDKAFVSGTDKAYGEENFHRRRLICNLSLRVVK